MGLFSNIGSVFSTAADSLLDIATGPIGEVAAKTDPRLAAAQTVLGVLKESSQGQAQAEKEVAPMAYTYSSSTLQDTGGVIDIPAPGTGQIYEGFAGAIGQVGSNVITGLFRGLGGGAVGSAIGGGIAGYQLGQATGGDACGCGPKQFVRFNKCGEPIITRKMKKTLIDAVNNCGPEAAMKTYGLNPELMTMIISKQFPPRKMGISGAQLSTTMKTARKLDRAHKMMQNYCKRSPVRRTR